MWKGLCNHWGNLASFVWWGGFTCMCKQVWKWVPTHHFFMSARVFIIFSTKRTVAIFPLCLRDNEVSLHLASDRLIKNVIGSVNHVLAWHGMALGWWWAGGRGCDRREAGQRDYCRAWGNKRKEEAIVRRSSPTMQAAPGHSGPFQKCAIVVGFCWGGGDCMMCLFISNVASVLWL